MNIFKEALKAATSITFGLALFAAILGGITALTQPLVLLILGIAFVGFFILFLIVFHQHNKDQQRGTVNESK